MSRKLIPLLAALCVLMGTVVTAQASSMGPDPNNPEKLKDRVVKHLTTSDKAQINRFIPKAYEMKNVNAGAVAPFVMDLVATEEGLVDTYVAPDEKSGVLLVSVPEYMIPGIDRLVAQLDVPELTTSSGTMWSYVRLKHRNSLDVQIPQNLLMWGASDNEIYPDVANNALWIHGAPSGVAAIESAILDYDVETPEVKVAVKVYEVEVTNDATLGTDFHAWKNGPGRALFTLGAFGEYEKVDYVNGFPLQFDSGSGAALGLPHRRMNTHGYNASYYYDVPSAFFDMLSVRGKARVATEASVTALSGEPAVFTSVEEILYYAVQPAPASTGDDVAGILPTNDSQVLMQTGNVGDRQVTGSITNRGLTADQAGLVLEVTPYVAEEVIEMDLVTELSDYMGFDDTGAPMINRREISNSVRSDYGEEVVLGGMTRTRQVKTTRKVPFLGSIPVVGYLFGGEITTKKQIEVVEVVQADCLSGCGGVTQEGAALTARAYDRLDVDTGRDEYGFTNFFATRDKYEPAQP